jgi:nitrogen fixation protein FixH
MGVPPPPKETEVEKTARFTRHLLQGIVIVIIIVVIVVALGFAYNAYQSINQVQLKVQYSGSWSGTYNIDGSITPFNGNGAQTITLDRPSQSGVWIIGATATAEIQGGSSGTLTISILKMDGTVLQTASTNSAYEGVAVIVDLGT